MIRSALKRCFQEHVSFSALQPRVVSQLTHGRVLVDILPVRCVLETRWRMIPVGLLWLLFYTVHHSRIDNTKTFFFLFFGRHLGRISPYGAEGAGDARASLSFFCNIFRLYETKAPGQPQPSPRRMAASRWLSHTPKNRSQLRSSPHARICLEDATTCARTRMACFSTGDSLPEGRA